jgi:hypothetical protein
MISQISTSIVNGENKLILSEVFSADDNFPVTLALPTKSGSSFYLSFVFDKSEVSVPEGTYIENIGNKVVVRVKMGSGQHSKLGTSSLATLTIEGQVYSVIYSLERLLGSTLRISFSLFERINR